MKPEFIYEMGQMDDRLSKRARQIIEREPEKAEKLSRLARAIGVVVSFNPGVFHALNDMRPKIDRAKKRDVDANIRRIAEANYDELDTAYNLAEPELDLEEVVFLNRRIHEFMPKFVLAKDCSPRKPDPTPTATRAKKLSRPQIEARRRGGEARAVLSDDVQSVIRTLYGNTSKARSHSWRCGQAARLAGKQNLKRNDGDPISKRNVSDYIARLSKPD